MSPSSHAQCLRLHALLAESTQGPRRPLTADDDFVEHHLASCERCQQDVRLLAAMEDQLKRQIDTSAPSHATAEILRAAVCERKPSPWSQRIRDWIRLPVPAYGIALAALLLAGVSHQQAESPPAVNMADAVSLADASGPVPALTRTDSDNVLANLRLVDRFMWQVDRADTAAPLLPGRGG